MDNSLLVSLSQQLAAYRAMDVIANNLANASTPGFKREAAKFEEFITKLRPAEGQKGARFLTDMKDLDHVTKALKAAGWNVIASEMRYIAKTFPELSEAARKQVADFLNALDDHDDVHRVYAAMK